MDMLTYNAFSEDPRGGNPAGVVLDATGLDDAAMQTAAAEAGHSESVFFRPGAGGEIDVRYFSPLAEVPFCGHATIAGAVAHAQAHGPGLLRLRTRAGLVEVTSAVGERGVFSATLVSVPPAVAELPGDDLAALLAALRWGQDDLDPALPARVAYAGAWHPVVAVGSRDRLARLDYDYDALARLMAARDWTTIQLVHRESPTTFHSRNPFPPGGVVEDPATGAAAAALGGYLRELGLVDPPATFTVHQGVDMGRPSAITVAVPADRSRGISVSGAAVRVA